jgi:hypothetical protein
MDIGRGTPLICEDASPGINSGVVTLTKHAIYICRDVTQQPCLRDDCGHLITIYNRVNVFGYCPNRFKPIHGNLELEETAADEKFKRETIKTFERELTDPLVDAI